MVWILRYIPVCLRLLWFQETVCFPTVTQHRHFPVPEIPVFSQWACLVSLETPKGIKLVAPSFCPWPLSPAHPSQVIPTESTAPLCYLCPCSVNWSASEKTLEAEAVLCSVRVFAVLSAGKKLLQRPTMTWPWEQLPLLYARDGGMPDFILTWLQDLHALFLPLCKQSVVRVRTGPWLLSSPQQEAPRYCGSAQANWGQSPWADKPPFTFYKLCVGQNTNILGWLSQHLLKPSLTFSYDGGWEQNTWKPFLFSRRLAVCLSWRPKRCRTDKVPKKGFVFFLPLTDSLTNRSIPPPASSSLGCLPSSWLGKERRKWENWSPSSYFKLLRNKNETLRIP